MTNIALTADLTSEQIEELRHTLADWPELASQLPLSHGPVVVYSFFASGPVRGMLSDGQVEFHTGPMAGMSLPRVLLEASQGIVVTAESQSDSTSWSRITVVADRPMLSEDVRRAGGILGYALRQCGVHVGLSDPQRWPGQSQSFFVKADSTVTPTSMQYFRDLLESTYATILRTGTPVRAGTRLIEGFGSHVFDFNLIFS